MPNHVESNDRKRYCWIVLDAWKFIEHFSAGHIHSTNCPPLFPAPTDEAPPQIETGNFCSKQNVQFLYSYFRGSICAICNYNFNKYYRSVIEAMVGVFVPEKYVTGHAQGPDQNIASENDIVEEGTTSLDRVRAHLYLMNCQRGLYLPSLDDHLYHAIVRTYL